MLGKCTAAPIWEMIMVEYVCEAPGAYDFNDPCKKARILLQTKALTPSAYCLWQMIYEKIEAGIESVCEMSYQTFASLMSISRKTAMHAVSLLEKFSLLEKIQSRNKKNDFLTNKYQLPHELQRQKRDDGSSQPQSAVSMQSEQIIAVSAISSSPPPGEPEHKPTVKTKHSDKISSIRQFISDAKEQEIIANKQIFEEPGVKKHLDAYGELQAVISLAEAELERLLAESKYESELLEQKEADRKELAAIENPSFCHELAGSRKLSEQQFNQLANVMKNFDLGTGAAINSAVFQIRFGSLVKKSKTNGVNSVNEALSIAVMLIRAGRFMALEPNFILGKLEDHGVRLE